MIFMYVNYILVLSIKIEVYQLYQGPQAVGYVAVRQSSAVESSAVESSAVESETHLKLIIK